MAGRVGNQPRITNRRNTQPGSAIDAVIATDWDGIDLIPAHLDLSNAESSGASDLVFRLDVAFDGLDLSPYEARDSRS